MSVSLNEFFKKSVELIDNQDLEREFNEAEMKHATKIAQKDLEINDINSRVDSINKRTDEIKENTMSLKNKLKSINETLED